MEIHRSAGRHGASDDDIEHVCARPLVAVDLDPDADPPKVLVVGPGGQAAGGDLLELDDDRLLVIHAMGPSAGVPSAAPDEEGTDG